MPGDAGGRWFHQVGSGNASALRPTTPRTRRSRGGSSISSPTWPR